jgi:transketolase
MQRFRAAGWSVFACDGHDPDAIDAAMTAARESAKPSLIACKTQIGYGAPTKQDSKEAHGSPLGAAEIARVRDIYGWPHEPFVIPDEVRAEWQAIGRRGAAERAEWEARRAAMKPGVAAEFARVLAGKPPKALAKAVAAHKRLMAGERPRIATRKASELVLAAINPAMPETVGGSADLTGSNNTLTPDLGIFEPGNRKGRYVHYGVREHGMAAAMNGMALHGGVVPYGGTFLCFSDYSRPAIRLAALMRLRVIHVMTHDSIGLGEDGPTHQPVEHLAALRAIPGLAVFRPADAVETAECWELALTAKGPSVLALTRQNLAALRIVHRPANLCALGAYVIAPTSGRPQAVLMASGSEVEIACFAQKRLASEGIAARVVSMPCWERFEAQEEGYRKKVLPAGPVRVAVEAGVRQGWDRWLCGERGAERKAAFIGMEGFGASAPAEALYAHFGITADRVVAEVKRLL